MLVKSLDVRDFVLSVMILASAVGQMAWADATDDERFAIEDYFRLNRIQELSLSQGGEWVAYIVEQQSLLQNMTVRDVYISRTTPHAEPIGIDGIEDVSNLAWIPGKKELAFLSHRDGVTQVYSYNVEQKRLRKHTNVDATVVEFRFSPDGKSLAYTTQEQRDRAPLYEQMRTGEKGLLIDPNIFRVQHFTDPTWRLGDPTPPRRLWIKLTGREAFMVTVPGDIKDFHWASDSEKLALTYDPEKASTTLYAGNRRSIGVYYLDSRRFRSLASGILARPGEPGTDYTSDGWLFREDKLIIRRARITDYLASPRHPEWSIVDISNDEPLAKEESIWHGLSLTGLDPAPLFHPLPGGKVLINKTVNGGYRTLYVASRSTPLRRADITVGLEGNVSMVRFSADGARAAFVYDSLAQPPEIFLWHRGEGLSPLTSINRELAVLRLPIVREIHWMSRDGTNLLIQ